MCIRIILILCYFNVIYCGTINEENYTESESRGLDTKGLLSSLASNFMSRGYGVTGSGTSQVVSLNLTNLFVLVLLKALIFAAGSLGAGTWKGGLARSNDGEETFINDEEILLFLGYLTGSPGNNGCLQRISCRQPERAKKYVAAGEILLKGSKMLSMNPDSSYAYVLREVESAANFGSSGGNCEKYECPINET